jgi:hypothetical protein
VRYGRFITSLAQASGIETPTRADLVGGAQPTPGGCCAVSASNGPLPISMKPAPRAPPRPTNILKRVLIHALLNPDSRSPAARDVSLDTRTIFLNTHGMAFTTGYEGRTCFNRESRFFAGQNVGVTQVGNRMWPVSVCSVT